MYMCECYLYENIYLCTLAVLSFLRFISSLFPLSRAWHTRCRVFRLLRASWGGTRNTDACSDAGLLLTGQRGARNLFRACTLTTKTRGLEILTSGAGPRAERVHWMSRGEGRKRGGGGGGGGASKLRSSMCSKPLMFLRFTKSKRGDSKGSQVLTRHVFRLA
jgi:hypothetical protein